MASTAAPLAFACEADEKAYAALMKKLNNKPNHLAIPGFSFAVPGAHTYPAGVFPAMVQLIRKAPNIKNVKAAKALVAEAALARVKRTGADDKTVHREDIQQAIVLLANDELFTGPLDGSSAAKSTAEKQSIKVVVPQQQHATTGADAAKTEEVAATVKFDGMETYGMTITVRGLAPTIEREIDNKLRLFREKVRQCESERDGAVAAQAIVAGMLHEIDGEKNVLDRLVDELQKERNEWRDIAIERNGTTAALTKERDECWGVVKNSKKLFADRNEQLDGKDKQLDDMAKQLDDMEKQRGCWRDIANNVHRQRDDWHGRAGDMKEERDEKQKERDLWKEFAQDMKAQRDILRGEVEQLSTKYSTLKEHTEEHEQETERLRKELRDCNTQCDGLAKEVEALKEQRDSSQGRRRKFPKLTDSCPFTED